MKVAILSGRPIIVVIEILHYGEQRQQFSKPELVSVKQLASNAIKQFFLVSSVNHTFAFRQPFC